MCTIFLSKCVYLNAFSKLFPHFLVVSEYGMRELVLGLQLFYVLIQLKKKKTGCTP